MLPILKLSSAYSDLFRVCAAGCAAPSGAVREQQAGTHPSDPCVTLKKAEEPGDTITPLNGSTTGPSTARAVKGRRKGVWRCWVFGFFVLHC